MRDIRQDLRERLAQIDARSADWFGEYDRKLEALSREHREMVSSLDREREAVKQMLDIEEARQGVPAGLIESRKTARLVALPDFIITSVRAHGPIDKDQLRSVIEAAGYFAEGNGRMFHTTLMNITKAGRLSLLADGRYALPSERKASTLFEGDNATSEEGARTLM
jgi:hypothetical protein